MSEMASTIAQAKKCLEEIGRGSITVEERLEGDVTAMCELIETLRKKCEARARGDTSLKDLMRKHFGDIYWNLKLHVVFHYGTETVKDLEELRKMGYEQGLTPEELDHKFPDEGSWDEYAFDPGSKLVELVSTHFRVSC